LDNLYAEQQFYYPGARTILVNLFYTIVICIFIAVFLTLTGIFTTTVDLKTFIIMLVISQCYGISTCLIIMFSLRAFKPRKGVSAVFIILTGMTCGILIGHLMAAFILQQVLPTFMWGWKKTFLKNIGLWLVLVSAIGYFFYSKRHLKISKEIIQQERINRLASEKEALEANLRLLQAQIEPHFLFNTLSNVLSLIDTDPTHGKSMLVDLIHYLRTSLSRTFPDPITLDQEMDMIKAYLNIQKIRMGERLHFNIELPEAVRKHPFPPMLLQPLVENAVKHGLEPKMEGGEIMIKAMEEDDIIRVEVADTGLGFASFEKTGVGIGNVRERIKLLFGEKGRLILEENEPNGVRAIIEVPKHDVQSHPC
jgi:sensor histidine kinase YesM